MTRWQNRSFGDLYSIPSRNGMMAPKKVRGAGARLVNMREIFAYRRIGRQEMERAPLTGRDPDLWLLREGDLLFARQSLTAAGAGKCVLVEEVPEPTTFESHIIRVRLDQNIADAAFYFYLFTSPIGRRIMSDIVEQVAAAGIRASDLGRLAVPAPMIDEQRRIARVLCSLDGLIDTNERLARDLEALARDRWRKCREEHAVRLSSVASVVLGGTPSRKVPEYWNGSLPWLNSGEANRFRVMAGSEGITDLGFSKSSAKMMPSGTTLVAITGATLGQVTRSEIQACGNQSLVGVYARGDQILSDHLYIAISEDIAQIVQHATGGAQQHVNRGNVEAMVIPALSDDGRELIRLHVSPLLAAIGPLLKESEQLRRARDELLPLLMSGKVRVSEVEDAVAP